MQQPSVIPLHRAEPLLSPIRGQRFQSRVLGRLYAVHFADHAAPIGSEGALFFEDPHSVLLQPIELFELSLSLPHDEQLFCLLLHAEWVSLILLQIHILVQIQTKCR